MALPDKNSNSISISQINTENTSTTSNSLKTLSDTATAGSDPADGAPYGIGEFSLYAHALPVVSNVQNYTGSVAGDFAAVRNYSGGFGLDLIDFQLVMKTTASGSNYVATLYIEETSNGLGVYNGAGMNTGTLYPIQTVTFTQANWPDTYALDHSVSNTSSSGGALQKITNLVAGTGESHTSGSNWDNTNFNLLNPTTGTAFKVSHRTTGECFTGTVIYTNTIALKFAKSGFPTLTAATFNITAEQDMNHSGLCP